MKSHFIQKQHHAKRSYVHLHPSPDHKWGKPGGTGISDLFSHLFSLLIFKQRADSGFGSAHSPPLGPGRPLLLLCMATKPLPLRELLSAGLSLETVSQP